MGALVVIPEDDVHVGAYRAAIYIERAHHWQSPIVALAAPTANRVIATARRESATETATSADDSRWLFAAWVESSSDATRSMQRKAHLAVKAALKAKTLVRPATCTRCPNPGPVEAHHFMGYEPRFWLEVLWLCEPCHDFSPRQHRPPINRRGYRAPRGIATLHESVARLGFDIAAAQDSAPKYCGHMGLAGSSAARVVSVSESVAHRRSA